MWVVALVMMAFMVLGGGHFFHKQDDGHRNKSTAATAETQPAHSHGAAANATEGPDRGNHQHAISSTQISESDVGGQQDSCSGDPDNPGAKDDDCP